MKVFKNKDQMFTFIFGCGLGGVVISFIEGARAGAKATKACEEANAEKLMDKIKVGGKYFTIPTLMLFASCCGITIPYVKEKRRNAALSALLASTAASYELYKGKVNELMPEKAKEIKKKIFEDTIKKNPQTSENTVKAGGNYSDVQTFYDVYTGKYIECRMADIDRAVNFINRILIAGDAVCLTDFYMEIDNEMNEIGQIYETIGWKWDNRFGDFKVDYDSIFSDGKAYVTISYTEPNWFLGR